MPASDARSAARAVEHLNALSRPAAEAAFLRCCGSTAWAHHMAERRPHADLPSMLDQADRVWWSLSRDAWLEAFRAHPRIGERDAATGGGTTRSWSWSVEEQAGAANAGVATTAALVQANRAYEQRFGHIYIVCAAGRAAEEMLALCRDRLANDAETELRVAAEEQRKITRMRLERLVRESMT